MKDCKDQAAPGEVFKFDPEAFSHTMPLNRHDRRQWAKKAKKELKSKHGKSLDISQAEKLGSVVVK